MGELIFFRKRFLVLLLLANTFSTVWISASTLPAHPAALDVSGTVFAPDALQDEKFLFEQLLVEETPTSESDKEGAEEEQATDFNGYPYWAMPKRSAGHAQERAAIPSAAFGDVVFFSFPYRYILFHSLRIFC